MADKKVDYIIVGQGIAGTLLAHFLLKKGKQILIFDDHHKGASSKVAAGIINPITGRRFVKSWMVDDLIPFAKQTYLEVEDLLQVNIFHSRNIQRSLFSIKEENDWLSRSASPDVKNYVVESESEELKNNFNDVFSQAEIQHTAQIDFPTLLDTYHQYFEKKGLIRKEKFNYKLLQINDTNTSYQNIEANKVIFCEGFQATKNPWFKNLPFVLAKGEILILRIPNLPTNKMQKSKLFFAPLGDDLFWVGATYDWTFENDKPTKEGKDLLLKKVNKALTLPFEIIDHKAAIRPTVFDRRPLIGLHSTYPSIGIFNGLGTKGASLGPYWANQMVSFLTEHTQISNEVNVNRKKTNLGG